MNEVLVKVEQFLQDEKELLMILAVDVADAETTHEMVKEKALYATQLARVGGIEDTLSFLKQELVQVNE